MADFYEALGVPTDADEKAIKKAYFRGVRAHPPERDQSGFRRIREAYETLSDPAARASYDALQQHGDKIAAELESGFQHFAEEEWDAAAASFKRVLLLDPTAHAVRNQLGLCQIQIEDYDSAIRTFQSLIKKSSEVSLYRINYGHALDQKAQSQAQDSPSESNRLTEEARDAFEGAIKLERHNAAPYLAIAETYLREACHADALRWADDAIGADGKVDFQDFEALFFKCRVYLFSGDLDNVSSTASRIRGLVPDDQDIKRFVAMRFAFFAQLLVNAEAFEPAGVFLRAAKQFDEDNEELAAFGEAIDEIIGLADDIGALENEPDVLPPVRVLVNLLLAARLGSEEVDAEALWKQALEAFAHAPQDELFTSFERMKARCPTFYKLQRELVDEVIKGTREAATAAKQCRTACEDPTVSDAPRMLCALFLDVARGYYQGKDWEFERDLQQVLQAFDMFPQANSRAGMARIRSRYPKVRAVVPDLFDRIDTLLRGNPSYAPSSHSASDPSCLAGDSMVLMADGTELPLKLVRPGDLVLAMDRRTGQVCTRRVRRVQAHSERGTVGVRVGGRWVRCTPGHLFLTAGGLVRASELRTGDVVTVFRRGGESGGGEVEAKEPLPPTPVFNLHVEGTSTYIAASVGVHCFVVLPELRESIERLRYSLARTARWAPRLAGRMPGLLLQMRSGTSAAGTARCSS